MNNVTISAEASRLMAQLAQLREAAAGNQNRAVDGSAAQDFSTLLRGYVNDVNQQQQQSKALATSFETGDSQVQLIDVMVSMQKSRVAFEALTQVRNRFLSAYQEIMNMQV